MRLNHLSITHFRNYTRLELGLPGRLTVFQGANAQGKTNLLEAVHLLATGRSPRAVAERDMINWLALESPLPYAHLVGEIGEGAVSQTLDLVLEVTRNAAFGDDASGNSSPGVRKQVRINGVPRRALDLVGRLRVVLFLPEDVSLVTGAPAERRRYLDIALCQIDAMYCRALAEYQRILAQRNALLRRLRDEGGDPVQLAFWDEQLVQQGSLLLGRRGRAVAALDRSAATRHADLTNNAEHLRLAYLPSPEPSADGEGHRAAVRPGNAHYAATSREEIVERLRVQLATGRARDIAAGATTSGPHRDDLVFTVEGRDLRAFGSRGQQRTAALALKLAELQMMQYETGDTPLLLLDDVMSELDTARRHALLDALAGVEQALVTTTDWEDFSPELLAAARRLHIHEGRMSAAA